MQGPYFLPCSHQAEQEERARAARGGLLQSIWQGHECWEPRLVPVGRCRCQCEMDETGRPGWLQQQPLPRNGLWVLLCNGAVLVLLLGSCCGQQRCSAIISIILLALVGSKLPFLGSTMPAPHPTLGSLSPALGAARARAAAPSGS